MELLEPQLNFTPSGMLNPADWGLILAEGSDAGTFLQGQLTNDVILLPTGQSRLSGYCSAKGRLLASFVVLKLSQEQFLMVCHKDLIAAMVKRLSMFVLRAKVKISDATSQFQVSGFLGDAAAASCPALVSEPPWRVVQQAGFYFIQLHPAKTATAYLARVLRIGISQAPQSHEVTPPSYAEISNQDWQLAEVLSGISMVQTATAEAFVPQMLNYESVEGVSFKKGCYPGQEVFSADDGDQACGMVSSAAKFEPLDGQSPQWWGIASLQLSASQNVLHLAHVTGPVIQRFAMPYPLLEDI
jgi:folate-binding protein YgfZ